MDRYDDLPTWVAVPVSLLFLIVFFDQAMRSAAIVIWLKIGDMTTAEKRRSLVRGALPVLAVAVLIGWATATFTLTYLPMVLSWAVVAIVAGGAISLAAAGARRARSAASEKTEGEKDGTDS